jgi:hypothetical protein
MSLLAALHLGLSYMLQKYFFLYRSYTYKGLALLMETPFSVKLAFIAHLRILDNEEK